MQPQVPVTPSPAKPQKTGLFLPIFLIVGPTAILIATLLLYAIISYVISTSAPAGSELFAEQPIGVTIMNIITFIIGGLGAVAILPCFVLGLIMLVRRIERRKLLARQP